MDDSNSNKTKEYKEENQDSEGTIEKSQSSNKSIVKKTRLESAITNMLEQVMEDPDDTTNNSNSNNIMNSLKFNDDESYDEDNFDPKLCSNLGKPYFSRSNKRLKTVNNYTVNLRNMPLTNVNQFNFNRNNVYTMRTPSFGNNNYINNNAYSDINSYNQYNNNSSHSSVNNMNIEPNYNNQMNNYPNFYRNMNPYSRTVIYHYPLNIYNTGFGLNTNMNNNNNYSNINNNFDNQRNNNINFSVNNNDIPKINNNLKINEASSQNYKRRESRRKTYPTFNIEDEKPQQHISNVKNSNVLIPNYQIFYKYHSNENQINYNTEYLILTLKFNLEKAGKIDHYIYSLIKGTFINIIKNQKGSKIFQKYLNSTHSDILHQIFIELKPNLEDIIIDSYANYFVKRFFTYLNQKDRVDFLISIEKIMVKLSSDSIGTYPIQTIIEHVGSKNEKLIIVDSLKENIKELCIDPFGSHVLEKLLSCFEEEYIGFLYTYIVDNFLELAYNNNGICIVKKILTFTHKKTLHDKLKIIVKENAVQLISHSCGNFVIQVVVDCWSDYGEILNKFDKKFCKLSLEKYASNVVERCIEKDDEILNNYIDEIINKNKIIEVMKSNYGNYVIQKAIKLSKGLFKQKLIYNASKDINKLNEQKLIKKWKSILIPHIKDLSNEQIESLKEQKFFL